MNTIIKLFYHQDINKLNAQNIIKIQCVNNRHMKRFTKRGCKNCLSFVCKSCAKFDHTKCLMCPEINENYKSECGSCTNKICKWMCHLCGKIIAKCFYKCSNDEKMYYSYCHHIHCGNCKYKKCNVS